VAGDQALAQTMLAMWEEWDSDFETHCATFKKYCAEDFVWWNTDSFGATTGYDEAFEKVLVPSHSAPLLMDRIQVKVHNIAQVGNIVYHERDDILLRADGTQIVTCRIAGVTEFNENGLIQEWREYCDPTELIAKMTAQA